MVKTAVYLHIKDMYDVPNSTMFQVTILTYHISIATLSYIIINLNH